MKQRTKKPKPSALSDAQTTAMDALGSYHEVLACLTNAGSSMRKKSTPKAQLRYIDRVDGLENLYRTFASVAPAVPAAPDEEWNPLSQRPHAPLPPSVGGELGLEVTALKEAVDAFTTLSHELMHVALWEPFFTGTWRPRNKRQFREFSLMAEGFCFFFSDIIVSGLVRVRFPDGEFALARQTPSNALFHPLRAFHALGIVNHDDILSAYLDGFSGKKTPLLKPRGTSNFVEALAARIYEFYSGTLGYLDQMHEALSKIGALGEFFDRFCMIADLPSMLRTDDALLLKEGRLKDYFSAFYKHGQKHTAQLPTSVVTSIQWRRMLQTRAYYALQVRWYLREGLFFAKGWRHTLSHQALAGVEEYLDSLESLLIQLGKQPHRSPLSALAEIDKNYDANVRKFFIQHEVWTGHRWLIVPTRAGGIVSVFDNDDLDERQGRIKILRTVAFIVDELTRQMKASQTVEERAHVLASIQRVSAIGAKCGKGNKTQLKSVAKSLKLELQKPGVRETWALALADFDPCHNLFRELAFSYQ